MSHFVLTYSHWCSYIFLTIFLHLRPFHQPKFEGNFFFSLFFSYFFDMPVFWSYQKIYNSNITRFYTTFQRTVKQFFFLFLFVYLLLFAWMKVKTLGRKFRFLSVWNLFFFMTIVDANDNVQNAMTTQLKYTQKNIIVAATVMCSIYVTRSLDVWSLYATVTVCLGISSSNYHVDTHMHENSHTTATKIHKLMFMDERVCLCILIVQFRFSINGRFYSFICLCSILMHAQQTIH